MARAGAGQRGGGRILGDERQRRPGFVRSGGLEDRFRLFHVLLRLLDILHQVLQLIADLPRIAHGDGLISDQLQHVFGGGTLSVDHLAVLANFFELLEALGQDLDSLTIDLLHLGRVGRELLLKLLPSDPPKVQEINRKRIEILAKRLEKFEKIRENRQVVDAQCAATEDVLQLIRDQSVTMRDPRQISDQLENLVQDVEQTEQNVKEVEAIFELATPDEVGPPLPLISEDPSSGSLPRTRVRN